MNNDTLWYYSNLAEMYTGLGNFEKAAEWNNRCIEKNPANPFNYYRLILDHVMLGQPKEAYENLLEFMARTGSYDTTSIYTGYALWNAGRVEEARRGFTLRLEACEDSFRRGHKINDDWYAYFDYVVINAFLGKVDKIAPYLKEWKNKKHFNAFDYELVRSCPLLDNIRNENE